MLQCLIEIGASEYFQLQILYIRFGFGLLLRNLVMSLSLIIIYVIDLYFNIFLFRLYITVVPLLHFAKLSSPGYVAYVIAHFL